MHSWYTVKKLRILLKPFEQIFLYLKKIDQPSKSRVFKLIFQSRVFVAFNWTKICTICTNCNINSSLLKNSLSHDWARILNLSYNTVRYQYRYVPIVYFIIFLNLVGQSRNSVQYRRGMLSREDHTIIFHHKHHNFTYRIRFHDKK